jgi:hypothetical protein
VKTEESVGNRLFKNHVLVEMVLKMFLVEMVETVLKIFRVEMGLKISSIESEPERRDAGHVILPLL